MTKEELIDKREDLRSDFHGRYVQLGWIYADERCPAKVGDIVRGAGVYIKVEKIYYDGIDEIFSNDMTPYCILHGTIVNKQGEPHKSGAKRSIYPWAVREVNGKKVTYDWRK